MNIQPIISTISDDFILERFWVANIIDKKRINEIIRELNHEYPLLEYKHLKRVNGKMMKILIAPNIPHTDININGLDPNLSYCDVPKYPSFIKHSYILANNIWPSIYCENKKIKIQLENLSHLITNQETLLLPFLQQIKELAKKATVSCDEKVGALIINPDSLKVLTMSQDTRKSSNHPLNHAIMTCIKQIAESQTFKCNMPDKKPSHTAYLCTNYHLFVTREPCLMCSMALIHARIQRVYYISSSPHGALGTNIFLHSIKLLNHNFEVFQVTMPESS